MMMTAAGPQGRDERGSQMRDERGSQMREDEDLSEMGLYQYMQNYDNPRLSMSFSSSKGLLNAPGQNNCFLNSAVQVLFHLDVFRRNFRQLSGHWCMGNSCIFCALKVIFNQFQHSDESVLPADSLRQAMAETFADQQKFQLGFMDDAAECFENIMLRVHTHTTGNEKDDTCTAKHCIPHQKFTMSIMEQVRCNCGKASEPFTFNEMVYYVSTKALVAKYSLEMAARRSGAHMSFATLLRDTVAAGDERWCPNNCGANSSKKRNLMNCPDVVSIGLVWDSQKSSSSHIKDVVQCIDTTLRLPELFHNAVDERCHNNPELKLVGVVCYYGKHYSTFFYHSKIQEWVYLDDAVVKQVGVEWEQVAEKLYKGRYQPLLLLYANPDFKKIVTEDAPKTTTMVDGYEWTDGPVDKLMAQCNSYNLELKLRKGGQKPPRSSRQSIFSYSSSESTRESTASGKSKSSAEISRKPSFLSAVTADSRKQSMSSVCLTGGAAVKGDPRLRRPSNTSESSSLRRPSNASESSSLSSASNPAGDNDSDEVADKQNSPPHQADPKLGWQRHGVTSDYWLYSSQPGLTGPAGPANKDYYGDGTGTTSSSGSSNYATLPRKKKNLNFPTSPSDKDKHTNWMAEVARKSDEMHLMNGVAGMKSFGQRTKGHSEGQSETNEGQGARKKIDFYAKNNNNNNGVDTSNGMRPEQQPKKLTSFGVDMVDGRGGSTDSRGGSADSRGGSTASPQKPSGDPYIKPSLLYGSSDKDSATYIKRSSVEKILNQQRKTNKGIPNGISGPKVVKPSHDMPVTSLAQHTYLSGTEVLHSDLDVSKGLHLDIPPDNASIGSFKDSGYRSCGDRNSTSASSVSSLSMESPTIHDMTSLDKTLENGDFINDGHRSPYNQYNNYGSHSKQLSHGSSTSDVTLKNVGHRTRDSSTDSLDSLHSSHTIVKAGSGGHDNSTGSHDTIPAASISDRMHQLALSSKGTFGAAAARAPAPTNSSRAPAPTNSVQVVSSQSKPVRSILKTSKPNLYQDQQLQQRNDQQVQESYQYPDASSADVLPQFIPPPLEYANSSPDTGHCAPSSSHHKTSGRKNDDYYYEDEEESEDEGTESANYHDYMNVMDVSKASPFDDRCVQHLRQKSDESIQLYGTLPRNRRKSAPLSSISHLKSTGNLANSPATSIDESWPPPPPESFFNPPLTTAPSQLRPTANHSPLTTAPSQLRPTANHSPLTTSPSQLRPTANHSNGTKLKTPYHHTATNVSSSYGTNPMQPSVSSSLTKPSSVSHSISKAASSHVQAAPSQDQVARQPYSNNSTGNPSSNTAPAANGPYYGQSQSRYSAESNNSGRVQQSNDRRQMQETSVNNFGTASATNNRFHNTYSGPGSSRAANNAQHLPNHHGNVARQLSAPWQSSSKESQAHSQPYRQASNQPTSTEGYNTLGFYNGYGNQGGRQEQQPSSLPPKQSQVGLASGGYSGYPQSRTLHPQDLSHNSRIPSSQPPLWKPPTQHSKAFLQGDSHYDRPPPSPSGISHPAPAANPSGHQQDRGRPQTQWASPSNQAAHSNQSRPFGQPLSNNQTVPSNQGYPRAQQYQANPNGYYNKSQPAQSYGNGGQSQASLPNQFARQQNFYR